MVIVFFRYDEETRTSTQSSTCDKGQSSLNVDNNSIIGSIDTKVGISY